LLDPASSVLWETTLEPGERRRVCVPHEAACGDCSLLLTGSAPGGLTSFSGTIWISVYDGQGSHVPLKKPGLP